MFFENYLLIKIKKKTKVNYVKTELNERFETNLRKIRRDVFVGPPYIYCIVTRQKSII